MGAVSVACTGPVVTLALFDCEVARAAAVVEVDFFELLPQAATASTVTVRATAARPWK